MNQRFDKSLNYVEEKFRSYFIKSSKFQEIPDCNFERSIIKIKIRLQRFNYVTSHYSIDHLDADQGLEKRPCSYAGVSEKLVRNSNCNFETHLTIQERNVSKVRKIETVLHCSIKKGTGK